MASQTSTPQKNPVTPNQDFPAPSVTDMQLALTVIQCAEFKSNYAPVAEKLGINTPGNAQRRFKTLVEKYGFELKEGQIVGGSGVSKQTPRSKPRKSSASASSGKKRKSSGADGEGENGNVNTGYTNGVENGATGDGSPKAKKRGPRAGGGTKKAAKAQTTREGAKADDNEEEPEAGGHRKDDEIDKALLAEGEVGA